MGTPAWQQRAYEQQEIVRELARRVHGEADRRCQHPWYVFEFLRELLGQLNDDVESGPRPDSQKEHLGLVAETMKELQGFSRVSAETSYLACLLMKELMPTIDSVLMSPYQRAQIEDPQTAFGASSATHQSD